MRNFKKISQPHSFQPSLNIILRTRAEEQLIVTHLTGRSPKVVAPAWEVAGPGSGPTAFCSSETTKENPQ